jgi:hypothetical protein
MNSRGSSADVSSCSACSALTRFSSAAGRNSSAIESSRHTVTEVTPAALRLAMSAGNAGRSAGM